MSNSTRIQGKLNRMKPEPRKLICYLRGYDSNWWCLSEEIYKDSTKAGKVCDSLNRNPGSELNYLVEVE